MTRNFSETFKITNKTFEWKRKTYLISDIKSISYNRIKTKHSINLAPTGESEEAEIIITNKNGKEIYIFVDEAGIYLHKNKKEELAEIYYLYEYLSEMTFDNRLKLYENEIDLCGVFKYQKWIFDPKNKSVIIKNKTYTQADYKILKSDNFLVLEKRIKKTVDKLKTAWSGDPEIKTLKDSDVIFTLLKKYMGWKWS